jgi:diadenosine tetraphosphate (Ap4A) HIT family hydrolase
VTHDPNCQYCTKAAKMADIMVEAMDLPTSIVYLWKDSRYKGRCVVALKDHKTELCDLDEQQRVNFMSEVARVVAAIRKGFGADKINYGIYGDGVPHFHFHLVPKKKDGPEWGKPFLANPPDLKLMSEAEIQDCIKTLKSNFK